MRNLKIAVILAVLIYSVYGAATRAETYENSINLNKIKLIEKNNTSGQVLQNKLAPEYSWFILRWAPCQGCRELFQVNVKIHSDQWINPYAAFWGARSLEIKETRREQGDNGTLEEVSVILPLQAIESSKHKGLQITIVSDVSEIVIPVPKTLIQNVLVNSGT